MEIDKLYDYITTKDLIDVGGCDGDMSLYSVKKDTPLRLFYFDQCCMQFETPDGIEIGLHRVDPHPEDMCNYDKYFTLPDGVEPLNPK